MTDKTAKTYELLSCPFCGGRADFVRGITAKFDVAIECVDCEAQTGTFGAYDNKGGFDYVQAAIDSWNTRAGTEAAFLVKHGGIQ